MELLNPDCWYAYRASVTSTPCSAHGVQLQALAYRAQQKQKQQQQQTAGIPFHTSAYNSEAGAWPVATVQASSCSVCIYS